MTAQLMFAIGLWLAAVTSTRPATAGTDDDARLPAPTILDRCAPRRAGPARAVVRTIDSETLQLDDGAVVRLIGALAPRTPMTVAAAAEWPPETEATRTLNALVKGATVQLWQTSEQPDRHGRLLAHVVARRGADAIWVQARMLATGHARFYGLPGQFHCAAELQAHEQVARARQLGLWRSAAYQTRQAARTGELMRLRSTYQIVAGRVAKVGRTRGRLYLNFGADWRTDFTIGISNALTSANPAWASDLDRLAGAIVHVRGWIDRRNGPYIELSDPSELEVVVAPASQGRTEGH